ncbi:MAG: histidinol-phosphatase HisJ family protein [Bacteroidales bacterium]
MSFYNLHTHSHFCDGKESPEEYVKQAVHLGFHTLGFSSHAPVPFENKFALKEENVENYFETIRNLKRKYKSQIQILLSMEIDFIPGLTRKFDEFRQDGSLDYVIGGVHLIKNRDRENLWFIDGPLQEKYDEGLKSVFDGHARRGVEAYYGQMMEMIATQHPDVIAHFDKIKCIIETVSFRRRSGIKIWFGKP